MAELQRVIEGAPRYAEIVTGAPPGRADAQSTYSILPEGKSYDDRFVFGILAGDRMVGCIDLVRGYPNPHTAFLGLLLIAEPFQRRGIGRAALEEVEAIVRGWSPCNRIRASVVRVNERVMPFWTALGFRPTGETRPYRYGPIDSEHVLIEKSVPTR